MADQAKPKKWREMVAGMPALTEAQRVAVGEILEYHLSCLVSDHPPVDEAWYLIQEDLKQMGKS